MQIKQYHLHLIQCNTLAFDTITNSVSPHVIILCIMLHTYWTLLVLVPSQDEEGGQRLPSFLSHSVAKLKPPLLYLRTTPHSVHYN